MELSEPSRINVIGRGRVGAAFAARCAAQGMLSENGEADVVLLCVPDAAISTVARQVPVGPWVAHVSGATALAALAPHVRRFSVHPLQTFTRSRGPEQIDGAWAAVTAENAEARATGWTLARRLGLHAFDLADDSRAIYHAGASIASNFLVTLHRAAVRALGAAGAPPEALLPLMQRTIDNGFDLTGPISRGDRATVDAHVAAIRRELPDLEALYRVLAEATRP
jgi:predicted short-subunit dehydrogenase-like oxidoreductase (DUF2520 family)